MTILVTLTLAGANTGPFDIYSDADGYTIPLAVGVSKAALLAGYSLTGVPSIATIIRVQSQGDCDNFIDLLIDGETTTTTTTTTTSTSTTTSTTTTITPSEYYYYDVQRYDCALGCAPGTTAIARNTNLMTIGYFYNNGDGFVYEILSVNIGPSYTIDLFGAPSFSTCSAACGL